MSRPRGTGRIYLQKRSSMWWIQYYRKGVMYRESTRTSDKVKATRLLILRLAAVSEETILEAEFERVRVAELAEDFFREARNNGMPAVDAEARWRLHLQPFFGPLRARQIADHWVDEYILQATAIGSSEHYDQSRTWNIEENV